MNTHVCWMLEMQVREGRDEVKAALAPFSPVVMAPAAGFSR